MSHSLQKKWFNRLAHSKSRSKFAPESRGFQTRLWARDSHELVSGPFQDSSWLTYLNLQFMENVILALPAECWRWIPGYEGLYQVSTRGRVRSVDRWVTDKDGRKRLIKGKILKQRVDKDGYLRVTLSRDGKKRVFLVHRLVAETWLDNPEGKPEVNHLDENPGNPDVFNLSYCTRKENNNWGTRNKRLSKAVQAIVPKTGAVVLEFPSVREAGRKGFNQSAVSACCLGKRKTHRGYIWRYKE